MGITETVIVIIPFLNEEANIESIVNELNTHFKNWTAFKLECVFVDDGSTDNSFSKLQACNFGNFKASIIKLSRNFGAHAAVRAGLSIATGDYFTFLPADLQDPIILPELLYNQIREGYDIVWANRKTTKSKFFESVFSKLYAALIRKFVYADYPINGFDIVMFNSKVRNQLNLNIENNSSIFLQILTLGFKQNSIQYDKMSRKEGKSKWTFSKKIKLFIDSFIAFSFAPIRFVTIMGFSFFLLGMFWMFYILVRKVFIGDVTAGWPALASTLLIGFGITNISLGIIAEYLWRTLDASRKRPVFIIDEIIEITPNE